MGNGLANIGNSCYMNAIVQVLAHIPKFRLFLNQQCKGEITESLKTTFREIFNDQISIVNPKNLKYSLGKINILF